MSARLSERPAESEALNTNYCYVQHSAGRKIVTAVVNKRA